MKNPALWFLLLSFCDYSFSIVSSCRMQARINGQAAEIKFLRQSLLSEEMRASDRCSGGFGNEVRSIEPLAGVYLP